jgi:hypothetical protein
VPPDPAAVAEPLLPPKQLTFVVLVMEAASALDGWVMVTVCVAVQLLASVTVTVYVPAANAKTTFDVEPFDHK